MEERKEFEYDKQQLAVLSDNKAISKEFSLVSWQGNKPIYEIRNWIHNENGEEKAGKGIRLSEEELKVLITALNGLELK